ncbi:CLUMA_CG018668, isoform A [Clunio marinus]|uniref:CLUMA_CG018668, isoform A n=1 Tax=Clunio marinus TaxID=568069 RepID=A0A1J1J1G0_9DIPT|nr:CLUMA_CG018668, isoform A [Clunio marinus]
MRNKFLNFTICQIFIIIEVSLQCVMCQGRQENSPAQNVSYYERSFKKVLSRRKRFLVWRPGSNVLLTSSLAKPLAFEKPTGHNYIMEWDIFFPLPTSWRVPTKKPKTTTPPPTEETTLEVTHSWDPHSDSTGEIWMPSSGWAPGTDVIKAISHGKEADKRLWNSPWQQQQTLRESNWNDNNLFRLPSSLPVTQFKNPLLHNKTPWQQTLQQMTFNRNDRTNFNHQHYQSNRQPLSSNVERNFIGIDKQQQRRRFITKGRSLETLSDFRAMKKREVEESIEDDDDYWEHHHAHRDRRELYNLVESTSPLLKKSQCGYHGNVEGGKL